MIFPLKIEFNHSVLGSDGGGGGGIMETPMFISAS